MKSEQRRELKQNVLDSELARFVTFFQNNGNRIFWAVIIIAAVVLAVVYARNHIRQRQIDAYRGYEQLRGNVDMQPGERIDGWIDFAQNTQNRRLGGLALVAAGDDNLRLFLFTDGPERQMRLERAEELYRQTLTEYPDQPSVAAMAHFGLATVAVNRGQFDAARRECKELLKIEEIAGTPVAAEARRMSDRLAWLASPVAFVSQPETTPLDILNDLTPEDGQPGESILPGEFYLPGQSP